MGAYARDVPRPHRVQAAGIRHVVCRGIRGLPIFVDDFDREWYLGMLGLVCRDFGWRVLAWCLMTNHVHLVVDVPEDTISRGMQLLSGNYGQAFNWRHGHTGHLFQGRFHDELVDGASYGLTVVRYVDRNPERAGARRRRGCLAVEQLPSAGRARCPTPLPRHRVDARAVQSRPGARPRAIRRLRRSRQNAPRPSARPCPFRPRPGADPGRVPAGHVRSARAVSRRHRRPGSARPGGGSAARRAGRRR